MSKLARNRSGSAAPAVVPPAPPLRVLNKAFDEFDPEYDPLEDYAETAQRVRLEESAW